MVFDSQDVEFALVSEELIEGDGWTADVETYVEDGIDTLANNSGTKRYKCTGTFYVNIKGAQTVKWVTIWVAGTLSWNQDQKTATVTNCNSDYTLASVAFKKKDSFFSSGDNKGGFFGGNQYAYVEEKLVLTNGAGQNTFKLWLDVNV